MHVRVQHSITVELHAVGAVEFQEAYLKRVTGSIEEIGEQFDVQDIKVKVSGKSIIVTAHSLPIKSTQDFRDTIVRSAVLLAEHGPDADLLDELLIRYPDLRNHPDLPSLVSSFENMTSVLNNILVDERGITAAEVDRRGKEGITLVVEDLAASKGRSKRDMDPSDRAAFRDAAILGQTPEQVTSAKRPLAPDDAVLPDVYKKVTGPDPEAAGDPGNVFTTPSKGSTP